MDERKKDFLKFGLPPLLWMVVIFCGSSTPGLYIPKNYYLHQSAHFIEYSIFGILLTRGFAHIVKGLGMFKMSVLSVLLILAFALFDEWRQSFVPGRGCSLNTVFFDTAYAIFGVSLYDEVIFLLSRKKPKSVEPRAGV